MANEGVVLILILMMKGGLVLTAVGGCVDVCYYALLTEQDDMVYGAMQWKGSVSFIKGLAIAAAVMGALLVISAIVALLFRGCREEFDKPIVMLTPTLVTAGLSILSAIPSIMIINAYRYGYDFNGDTNTFNFKPRVLPWEQILGDDEDYMDWSYNYADWVAREQAKASVEQIAVWSVIEDWLLATNAWQPEIGYRNDAGILTQIPTPGGSCVVALSELKYDGSAVTSKEDCKSALTIKMADEGCQGGWSESGIMKRWNDICANTEFSDEKPECYNECEQSQSAKDCYKCTYGRDVSGWLALTDYLFVIRSVSIISTGLHVVGAILCVVDVIFVLVFGSESDT